VTTPWWAGLAPAALPIDCAGSTHRLRWADGVTSAPDHPDAARERTLTALGADPYPCLDVLDLWQRHTDDLDVLLLASRDPSDALATDAGSRFYGVQRAMSWSPRHPRFSRRSLGGYAIGPGRVSSGWTTYSTSGGLDTAEDNRVGSVDDLLRLGAGFPERLVATVVAAWVDRIEQDDPRVPAALPALHAALYGRLAAAVRRWLGDPRRTVSLTMTPAESVVRAAIRDGQLHVELPFAWLGEVWVNGLAVVLDRLCLSADYGDGRWTLATVDRDFAEVETLTITTTR
jgi:hypothetical protein